MNKIKVLIISLAVFIVVVTIVIFSRKSIREEKKAPAVIIDTMLKTTNIDTNAAKSIDKDKTVPPAKQHLQLTTKPIKRVKTKITAIDTATKPPEEAETVFTEKDADELDRILENVTKVTTASAVRANEIQDLEEQIATEEEKVIVQTWQQTTIEKQETKKNKDWAGYHNSLESRMSGLWQMGDSGAIAFYKDGTGQVSFIRDDKREQTLTGNFFFRYSIEGSLVQIIPILTKSSNRRITANFVVKVNGNKLQVGPYSYASMGKKK